MGDNNLRKLFARDKPGVMLNLNFSSPRRQRDAGPHYLNHGWGWIKFSQWLSVGLVGEQPEQGLVQFSTPIFQIMVAVKFMVMDGCAECFENLMGILYADDL